MAEPKGMAGIRKKKRNLWRMRARGWLPNWLAQPKTGEGSSLPVGPLSGADKELLEPALADKHYNVRQTQSAVGGDENSATHRHQQKSIRTAQRRPFHQYIASHPSPVTPLSFPVDPFSTQTDVAPTGDMTEVGPADRSRLLQLKRAERR